jgi:serine phosphatase RsbU (regulator of sigma subunit)/ligand-binding sensor protein
MIDLQRLQEFQDSFADIVGISAVIRDADGKRVTQPSTPKRHCSLVLRTLEQQQKEEQSSVEISLRSIRSGKIEEWTSPDGFWQFSAPITVHGATVGALVVGDLSPEQADPEVTVSSTDLHRPSYAQISLAVSLLQFAASALAALCHEGWVIRRHLQDLRTLYHASDMLTSVRPLHEVLPAVVRAVAETLDVKSCGLRLLDPATGELRLMAAHNMSKEYLSKGPVYAAKSELDRAAMEGEPVYIRDVSNDRRILYPREMLREGIRSVLLAGLKVKGRPIGVLRVYAGEKRVFHESEIALAEAVANLAAIAIDNAKLYDETLEKGRLEQELKLAAQIQTHLLPAEFPKVKGFEIFGVNEPCRQVGGDFYDFFDFDGGHLGIVIADVCGKSMGGALLMATARSAVRVQCEHSAKPDEIVTRVNRSLCRDTRPEEFVTLFFGKLDPATRMLRYSNAGHNRPLLLRGDKIMRLHSGGMVCGVLSETEYRESQVELETGDVLLLYTDGLDEARSASEQLFGVDRAIEALQRSRERTPSEIAAHLLDAVHAFTAGREQTDDMTLVVIKVK